MALGVAATGEWCQCCLLCCCTGLRAHSLQGPHPPEPTALLVSPCCPKQPPCGAPRMSVPTQEQWRGDPVSLLVPPAMSSSLLPCLCRTLSISVRGRCMDCIPPSGWGNLVSAPVPRLPPQSDSRAQHPSQLVMTAVWWQTPGLGAWLKERAFPPSSCSSEQARWTSEERGNPTAPSHPCRDCSGPLGSSQPRKGFGGESRGKALHGWQSHLSLAEPTHHQPPCPYPGNRAQHREIYWMPNRISDCGRAGSSLIGLQSN